MARYFSAHTTACLTKQALRELMLDLLKSKDVVIHRAVASQIGGRMLVEAEAPEQKSLERFFDSRHITSEWIMRIDLDAAGEEVVER